MLLSPHGRLLAHLADNPQARVHDLAQTLGVTDRAAQRVVADLVSAGYVERGKEGRRTTFTIRSSDLAAQLRGIEASAARPADGRRDDIQRRLLVAAEELVGQTGTFTEISVEDLIGAAGIARSTFYAYFSDKDDLLQALVENFLGDMWEGAQAWTTLNAGLSKDDLRAAMTTIGAAHRPHRLAMAAAAEAGPANARVRDQYDRLMETTKNLVRDHIVRGQAEGFINPALDAEDTAGLLTWGSELRLSRVTDDESEQVLESLTTLIWNLLYREAADGRRN